MIVDAYSKFIDIITLSHTTPSTTIAALHHTFGCFGLLEHLVTDNGSQFTNSAFHKDNCILQPTTVPLQTIQALMA